MVLETTLQADVNSRVEQREEVCFSRSPAGGRGKPSMGLGDVCGGASGERSRTQGAALETSEGGREGGSSDSVGL